MNIVSLGKNHLKASQEYIIRGKFGFFKEKNWTLGISKRQEINKLNRSIGALLVYDESKRGSFDNMGRWYEETKAKINDDAVILLIGNKSDLDEEYIFFDFEKNMILMIGDKFRKMKEKILQKLMDCYS